MIRRFIFYKKRWFYSFGEFYDRARCVFFRPTEILSMKTHIIWEVFLLARGGFFGVPPKKKTVLP